MADKRCENGHFIDESWDLCPYCPAESGEAAISVVRPARFSAGQREPRPAPPPTASSAQVAPPPPTVRRETAPVQAPPMDRTVAAQKVDVGESGDQALCRRLADRADRDRTRRVVRSPHRTQRPGRDRRSDIVVNDDQASSHHADLVFRPEERRFILMDHNSTNGTYVNEAEIEPRRDLVTKDVVRIGSQRFLFIPLCSEDFYWDDEGALK